MSLCTDSCVVTRALFFGQVRPRSVGLTVASLVVSCACRSCWLRSALTYSQVCKLFNGDLLGHGVVEHRQQALFAAHRSEFSPGDRSCGPASHNPPVRVAPAQLQAASKLCTTILLPDPRDSKFTGTTTQLQQLLQQSTLPSGKQGEDPEPGPPKLLNQLHFLSSSHASALGRSILSEMGPERPLIPQRVGHVPSSQDLQAHAEPSSTTPSSFAPPRNQTNRFAICCSSGATMSPRPPTPSVFHVCTFENPTTHAPRASRAQRLPHTR